MGNSPAAAPNQAGSPQFNGNSSTLPDSLQAMKAMLPESLEQAVDEAMYSAGITPREGKGKGKGEPWMDGCGYPQHMDKGKGKGERGCMDKGKGKRKGDADYWHSDKGKGKGDDDFMDKGKGKGDADFKGAGKGPDMRKGKGKGDGNFCSYDSFADHRLGSYDSFVTNVPMAGSFAAGAPNRMSFQSDMMGSRESFAARRSDESFAAGLPSSAAHAGHRRLPACNSFVPGPSGNMNTQPPEGRSTRMQSEQSFFVPAGQNTEPPHPGHSTRAPQCTSWHTQLPSGGSFACGPQSMPHARQGRGMEMIRE